MGGHGGRGRDGGRPLTLGSERVRAGKPFSSIICGAHAPADKKPTSLLATVAERDDNASPTSSKHLVFFPPLQDPQGNSGHSQLYHTECNPRARERGGAAIATRAQGGEHGASPYCSFQPSPTRRAMVVWSVAALSE